MGTSSNAAEYDAQSIISRDVLANSTDLDQAPPETGLHCGHGDLLGPVGLFVQGLLALIAFGSLVLKRFCEPKFERRSWKVWFFDTSKQAIGAAIIHFGNVFLADVFQGDPCTWYFVSFLLDSTVGLAVIYVCLKISQIIALRFKWQNLYLGEYGKPPRCLAWVLQCCLYVVVMIVEKFLMTLLVLFNFWKDVRKIILAPINNPNLEIVIVMFVVPFIINAIIFWVVDNFLKKKVFKNPRNSASTTDNAMKYFRAGDKVKYFTNSNHGGESDILITPDEDSDIRLLDSAEGSVSNATGNGVVPNRSDDDDDGFLLSDDQEHTVRVRTSQSRSGANKEYGLLQTEMV